MKFTVMALGQPIGTIDVTEEVYADDDALLNVLATAGYVDRSEVLEVAEDAENRIDIYEYETDSLRVQLVLIH